MFGLFFFFLYFSYFDHFSDYSMKDETYIFMNEKRTKQKKIVFPSMVIWFRDTRYTLIHAQIEKKQILNGMLHRKGAKNSSTVTQVQIGSDLHLNGREERYSFHSVQQKYRFHFTCTNAPNWTATYFASIQACSFIEQSNNLCAKSFTCVLAGWLWWLVLPHYHFKIHTTISPYNTNNSQPVSQRTQKKKFLWWIQIECSTTQ